MKNLFFENVPFVAVKMNNGITKVVNMKFSQYLRVMENTSVKIKNQKYTKEQSLLFRTAPTEIFKRIYHLSYIHSVSK